MTPSRPAWAWARSATAGGIACGPMSNRCAGGPQLPANGVANAQLAAIDTIVVLMLENRSFDNFLGGAEAGFELPGRRRRSTA